MRRNVKIKAIGIGQMVGVAEAEYSPSNWYGYKSVEPKEDDIERCEVAWEILLKHNEDGIAKQRLMALIKYAGYKSCNNFDMVLERFGYLMWIDGNGKLHPYRHPDGTVIDWQAPERLF